MLLPPDLREWVSGNDLAHFILEAVEGADLRAARVNSRGTGSAQYPPTMMLSVLIYCYARGIYSSRAIERACWELVPVRYLAGDRQPDHDTIAKFRRENGVLMEALFVEVLRLAKELKLLKLGTVMVDGTKLAANASQRATRTAAELAAEEARWEEAVRERLAPARKTPPAPPADSLPEPPAAPKKDPPEPTLNLSDPESRLQPCAQGGFIQGYNAQAALAAESGLIVACHVTQDTNDRRQLQPTFAAIPPALGPPRRVVADAGYDHTLQIEQVEAATGARVFCPLQTDSRPPGPVRPGSERARQRAGRNPVRARHASAEGRALSRWRRQSIEPLWGNLKLN